jgi:DnaJ-class molecular chaperone
MSYTKQVIIRCDWCEACEQDSTTYASLRISLRKKGWTTVEHYYKRDYCPACSKKRKAALTAMMAICPRCRGTGKEEEDVCESCGGSGDRKDYDKWVYHHQKVGGMP